MKFSAPQKRGHSKVNNPGTIYLIHLDRPLGDINPDRNAGRNYARHYIGWSPEPTSRLEEHRNGGGARMLAYAAAVGISFDIVRTWVGDRGEERRLKKRGHYSRLCPLCSGMAL